MSLIIDEKELSKNLIDNFFNKKLIGNISVNHIILLIPVILLFKGIFKK